MQEAPPEPTRIEIAKQKLLRIGSVVLGFGFIVALAAAVIGGSNPGANVNPIRVMGGIIMVSGLVTLLAGHRLAWARELWRRWGRPRWMKELPDLSRFFFTVLPIVVGVLAVTWTMLFMVPPLLAGLAIFILSFFIPVVLAVVVAEGIGYQKTFCLGALLPSCGYMLAMCMFFFRVIDFRGQGMARVFDDLGDGFVFIGIVWLFAVITGLAAVGVRVLIERLQPTERRWRE